MSARSRSAASPVPPAPPQDASRLPSSSAGLELRLCGWWPGFDKVRFTRLLRDEGLPLRNDVTATGRLLANESVTVRLTRLRDAAVLCGHLSAIGVITVERG